MGCDIHLFVEVRKNGKWAMAKNAPSGPVDEWDAYYSGRDYVLFGKLAGVRRQGIEGFSEPKGTPPDVSKEVQIAIDQWGVDGHSHNYFTLEELMTAGYGENWLQKIMAGGFTHAWEDQEGYRDQFTVETLPKLSEFLSEPGILPSDIRIVFFFDN